MSWWRRKKKEVKDAMQPATSHADAKLARQEAEQALDAARCRDERVRSVADAALHHDKENHFAELMAEAFRGRDRWTS